MKKQVLFPLSILFTIVLVLSACGAPAATQEPQPAEPAVAATEAPAAATEAPAPDLTGMQVTILGNRKAQTAEQFRKVLGEFTEQTGIEVLYEESTDFETQVVVSAEGGNPSDIVIFPQPGLLWDLAANGKLKPLDDIVDKAALQESLVPGFLDLGSLDGKVYGVPYRANLKSLIWYSPNVFAEKGYQIPETWDDLLSLSQQIQDDGGIPWCFGDTDGWMLTDWIEDILIHTVPAEKYDAWTRGELKFDSPEVRRAFELFSEIAFHEGWVLGGRQAIISVGLLDAGDPLLEEPPGCYLHKQADFFAEFIPDDAKIPDDVNFFPFPTIDPEYANSVVGGGEFVSLMTDNPAAIELVRWLSLPEAGTQDAAAGGFLSPHKTFDLSIYPNDPIREQARIVNNASVYRFDGADLRKIDASWP